MYCPRVDELCTMHCTHSTSRGCCGCNQLNPDNQMCIDGQFTCIESEDYNHSCLKCEKSVDELA